MVFRNPRHSDWREGHWTRLRVEEPFLGLPLFPAPRLWRVYFQVGFHFHLQVSDKSRQAPALSRSARGGRERGGTRAPTGVGSRTALWSGFLAFRPSCLKGLCIYLKKTAKPTALVDTPVPVFYPPFHPHINFLARRLSFQKRVWAVGGGAGSWPPVHLCGFELWALLPGFDCARAEFLKKR